MDLNEIPENAILQLIDLYANQMLQYREGERNVYAFASNVNSGKVVLLTVVDKSEILKYGEIS